MEPERRKGEARLEFANSGEGLYELPAAGAVDMVLRAGRGGRRVEWWWMAVAVGGNPSRRWCCTGWVMTRVLMLLRSVEQRAAGELGR